MSTRSDIHSPTNLKPEDYTLVGFIASPSSEEAADRLSEMVGDVLEHNQSGDDWTFLKDVPEPKFDGNHTQRGACDHCGAAFIYRVVYRHCSGEHICVGFRCAENTFPNTNIGHIKKRLSNTVKAAKTKAQNDLQAAEWLSANPRYAWLKGDPRWDNLYQAVRQWGELTEGQTKLVEKLTLEREQTAKDEACPLADCANDTHWSGIACTGKRSTIRGEIVGIKTVEGYYGYTTKLMVKADSVKVWTTCPGSLRAHRGDCVQFDAALDYKEDDFAIASRPTKASVLIWNAA